MNVEKFTEFCVKNFGKDILIDKSNPQSIAPEDEQTASEIFKLANSENVKLTIAGGQTLPYPFGINGEAVISVERFNSAPEFFTDDFNVIVSSGVTVSEAVESAAKSKLLITLDPLSRKKSTIGGAFMTGAEGPSSAGYGSFRRYLTGIRCVSPEGKIVEFGGKTAKNVTGYDGVNILYGTMGIFGLVTSLTIKVKPLPEKRALIRAEFGDLNNIATVMDFLSADMGNVSIYDITFREGKDSAIVVWLGYDGLFKLVDVRVERAMNFLSDSGAVKVDIIGESSFYDERAEISSQMTGPDFYTLKMPYAAVKFFIIKTMEIPGSVGFVAHPATGRVHVKCSDSVILTKLANQSKVLGGKNPLSWGYLLITDFRVFFPKTSIKS
jgi:FAD/FMN-containing dehydrogenase